MLLKRLLQWAVLFSCTVGSALNILYLSGVCGRRAPGIGFTMILLCWTVASVLKSRLESVEMNKSMVVDRIRIILTVLFSIVWLITSGIALVWIR